jgi:hypothetical protein
MSNAAKIFWTEFHFFSHISDSIPTFKEAQTGIHQKLRDNTKDNN